MKRNKLRKVGCLVAANLVSVCLAQAQGIVFDRTEVDLGVMRSREKAVERVFRYENRSEDTIFVEDILVTCGCTRVDRNKRVVLPHAKDSIVMRFDPAGRRNGNMRLVADIWAHNQRKKRVKYMLTMTGRLEAPAEVMAPDYVVEKQAKGQYAALKPADTFEEILEKRACDLIYRADIQVIDKEATPFDIAMIDAQAEELLATVRKGGYWRDIDYGCTFRTNWDPYFHVMNVSTLVKAYSNEHSCYYGNEMVYGVINEALKFWVDAKPYSHNWWFNDIGYCIPMTDILVMMSRSAKGIEEECREALLKRLLKVNVHRLTGANKTDVAAFQFFLACLKKDDKLARELAKEAFYPIRITTKEGIQEDYSYHQHGAHLYIGGYGSTLLRSIVDMQYYVQGTPYGMNEEQLGLLDRFLDTYLAIYRGRCLDLSTSGRGISRVGNLYNQISVSLLEKLSALEGIDQQKVVDFLKRYSLEKPAGYRVADVNVNYWRSDYMLQQGRRFMASVNTASRRTKHTEFGNGENLLGGNLSFGTLQLMRTGDEYLNIFPVWEWDKIPGVTAKKDVVKSGGLMGTSPYTGGVSTTKAGAFAYVHHAGGVDAVKGYFFTPEEVVALGCGIRADGDEEVLTTVNQCNLKGKVWYATAEGDTKVLVPGDSLRLVDAKWICHDEVAYVFPEGGVLTLKTRKQAGNWARININEPEGVVTKPVFNLVCEHGAKPVDGSYVYVMVPGCTKAKVLNGYDNVRVLANTKACQAIAVKRGDLVMVNFYEPGVLTVDEGLVIKVDRACSLIVERKKQGAARLYVADVTQTNATVKVELEMPKGVKELQVKCRKGVTQAVDL